MLEVKTASDLRRFVDNDVSEFLVKDEKLFSEIVPNVRAESMPCYYWNATTCQFMAISDEMWDEIKKLIIAIITALVKDAFEWVWEKLFGDDDEGSTDGTSTVLSAITVMKNKGYKAEFRKDEMTGKYNSIRFFK